MRQTKTNNSALISHKTRHSGKLFSKLPKWLMELLLLLAALSLAGCTGTHPHGRIRGKTPEGVEVTMDPPTNAKNPSALNLITTNHTHRVFRGHVNYHHGPDSIEADSATVDSDGCTRFDAQVSPARENDRDNLWIKLRSMKLIPVLGSVMVAASIACFIFFRPLWFPLMGTGTFLIMLPLLVVNHEILILSAIVFLPAVVVFAQWVKTSKTAKGNNSNRAVQPRICVSKAQKSAASVLWN